MVNNGIRKYTVLVSFLLHAHLIFYAVLAIILNLYSCDGQENPLLADNPIVFEFEPPPRAQQVIETPDDARVVEKQEAADLLSDKNARARNPDADRNLDSGAPFARGDLDVPELPTLRGPQGENGDRAEADSRDPSQSASENLADPQPRDYYAFNNASQFRRDYLVKKKATTTPGVQRSAPRVRYDNQATFAPDFGGLSFNTYAWDFAPYMMALKRKVERNIFPPTAFTRLGLIDGNTLLRFRIHPDGQMSHFEVIRYDGHKTLMETSRNAIRVSAPFPKLPRHFPKEYLEVTAKFSYFVDRNRR